ncbi:MULTISPECIES: carbohydrate ABC transporter permease [unclassified Actinomyces]|uniref:carbohydrate ABC transporter permease n=1 Tax=unclassified Actinomyces TaxID=2609248 RepID=UPI000D59C840|nr:MULTISPECIES: carbohydrate ABC transporter permease [unclassified Actinomyces]RAX21301.1 carbohydrate ABC transporter permease [Actinomyces sp. Z5]RAX22671.1 carbohydrate ABC transporter permease [Actinomyces sp. Z3]
MADRSSREAGTRRSTTFFVTSVLVLVSLYFIIPVLWVVINATKTTDDLFSTNGFWFGGSFALVENLRNVLTSNGGIFPRWFVNSLLYSGAGALLATYFAAAAGYALSKYEFRGKNLMFGLVMGGVLVPGTATALPLFLVFSRIGITNTYLAVLIPAVVSPFGLFLCRIYADAAVSTSLLEAGRIDGAGELTIFHRIALRQMVPALVTVFLFQFVAIWNNYFLPLIMLADERLYPITLGLNTWLSQTNRLPEFYQLTIGGALLSVIPLAILMLVLQRFWKGGLTEGAVKE